MDYQILNLLFRCNKQFSHEKIRLQELSDTECMICSFIVSHENSSQDDVAIALKTDKTTVSKAVASLEKKNCLVRNKDDTDKWVKRLALTASGQEKIAELINLHNNWLDDIMTCLSLEEQKQFENYCERLLTAAENLMDISGSDM